MDDTSLIRDLPSTAGPWCANGTCCKAVAWSHSCGLVEWHDALGRYHPGSRHIKHTTEEGWKGGSGF